MNQKQARQFAKRNGLDFQLLKATYRQLRATLKDAKEPEIRVRKMVWDSLAYSEGSKSFWRIGPKRRYSDAFNGESDMTAIPNWDCLASCVYTEEPWIAESTETASQELYDLIAQDYESIPSASETWEMAIELVESGELSEQPETATGHLAESF